MAETGLRLLTVHAHCDDETITMGGLLAQCADRGIETCLITCTDGKLATIFDPEMAADEAKYRPRLKEIREQEMAEAARILGITEHHFLEYGDSGMAGEHTNDHADAFWKADLDTAVGRVVAHIRRFKPQVVVTYDGVGGYGHPDHIQTHRVTMLAVEAAHHRTMYPELGAPWMVQKLYYTTIPMSFMKKAAEMAKAAGMEPPFGVENPEELPFITPDEYVTTTVGIRDQLLRKREALRAHRSQIAPDWPMLAIPESVALEHFSDEYFQLVISRKPPVLPETDVFAGLEVGETAAV